MPFLPRRLAVGRVASSFYCSPHPTPDLDPLPAIVKAFRGARTTILLAAYSFTHAQIADALVAAAARGVIVTLVVDKGQAASKFSQAQRLAATPGIIVHAWNGNGLMHSKAFVVDRGKSVGLGSYNFTAHAEQDNTEVLLISSTAPDSPYAVAMTDSIMSAFLEGVPVIAP